MIGRKTPRPFLSFLSLKFYIYIQNIHSYLFAVPFVSHSLLKRSTCSLVDVAIAFLLVSKYQLVLSLSTWLRTSKALADDFLSK